MSADSSLYQSVGAFFNQLGKLNYSSAVGHITEALEQRPRLPRSLLYHPAPDCHPYNPASTPAELQQTPAIPADDVEMAEKDSSENHEQPDDAQNVVCLQGGRRGLLHAAWCSVPNTTCNVRVKVRDGIVSNLCQWSAENMYRSAESGDGGFRFTGDVVAPRADQSKICYTLKVRDCVAGSGTGSDVITQVGLGVSINKLMGQVQRRDRGRNLMITSCMESISGKLSDVAQTNSVPVNQKKLAPVTPVNSASITQTNSVPIAQSNSVLIGQTNSVSVNQTHVLPVNQTNIVFVGQTNAVPLAQPDLVIVAQSNSVPVTPMYSGPVTRKNWIPVTQPISLAVTQLNSVPNETIYTQGFKHHNRIASPTDSWDRKAPCADNSTEKMDDDSEPIDSKEGKQLQ